MFGFFAFIKTVVAAIVRYSRYSSSRCMKTPATKFLGNRQCFAEFLFVNLEEARVEIPEDSLLVGLTVVTNSRACSDGHRAVHAMVIVRLYNYRR